MKKLVFIIVAIVAFSCQGKKTENKQNIVSPGKESVTKFEVNEEIHNFGTLSAGEIVIFSFVLKNTGPENLVVKKAEGDCGCITVKTDYEPVPPGKEKVIEVTFDTSGLYGKQYKSISVEANTNEKTKNLAIVAEVKNEILDINN
jgi:hypothetical protein